MFTIRINNVWIVHITPIYDSTISLTMLFTAQKRSVRALFATAQQPHSRDIFLNQKILPLDCWLTNNDRILGYKVINGTYLLGDILTDTHELDHYHRVYDHYQLSNDEHLRIPLHSTTHSQLFIRYRAILVIYVAHHPSPVSGTIITEAPSTISTS